MAIHSLELRLGHGAARQRIAFRSHDVGPRPQGLGLFVRMAKVFATVRFLQRLKNSLSMQIF